MGRYETLNDDSKDVVDCLLPGIAAKFKVDNVVDVIPADIRMRQWDCDRKDHIIDESEDDPRNWGLQFLKELITIARLKNGNLDEFHEDLRKKVEAHEDRHPWIRLQDIKDIKADMTAPPKSREEEAQDDAYESMDESSDNSYYELVEKDASPEKKRGRRQNSARKLDQAYEPRQQEKKPRKPGQRKPPKRLRRSEDDSWERPKKPRGRRQESSSPSVDNRFERGDTLVNLTPTSTPTPGFDGYQNLSLSELERELEMAEVELRAHRLRVELRKRGGNPATQTNNTPDLEIHPKSEPHSEAAE